MRALFIYLFLFLPMLSIGQDKESSFLEGHIKAIDSKGVTKPLAYANLQWLETSKGVQSNLEGHFKIERIETTNFLVASYAGYQSDTINTTGKSTIEITLKPKQLKSIRVTKRRRASRISALKTIKTEEITSKELEKGACCNLSESFETTPSIDVSFTDAVTGTRQIQMLGLAGQYTQILRENIPSIKGLTTVQGLTFVPGAWVESIQLNKGPGSVVNGYEGITGQINLCLKKPETSERLYLNLYANRAGRFEVNANSYHFVGKRWSTSFLVHAKQNQVKFDRNNDNFLDMPLSKHFIGMNRWLYEGKNGFNAQFAAKATFVELQGGEMDFDKESGNSSSHWGMVQNLTRYETFGKFWKKYKEASWKSMGLQLSASTHDEDNVFGTRKYLAEENSLYANYIYQSIIRNTFHVIKMGASFKYDETNEQLADSIYNRTETVPGVFGEYTYKGSKKFSSILGLRADYHNLFGAFLTPRVQMKYGFSKKSTLRGSIGRGLRTANIISENRGLLASSRSFEITGDNADLPYGLDAEIAWNFGLNYTKKFLLFKKEGSISFDAYRTDFTNQIVVDLEDPRKAKFYNLDGKSFSNSFQAQFDYELFHKFDVRLAYRFFDVQSTFGGEQLQKPFISSQRAFANLAYETKNNWVFDYTVSLNGEKRIPNTSSNPVQYQLPEKSPAFWIMNAQITKKWKGILDVYAGVENLLNFRQENPIIANEQPFGTHFDASQVWGPIFGRNIYIGIRYKIY